MAILFGMTSWVGCWLAICNHNHDVMCSSVDVCYCHVLERQALPLALDSPLPFKF